MGRREGYLALLHRVADGQGGPEGWATAEPGLDARGAAPLVTLGLVREARAEERAELSARSGRPVAWAVQLTADGRDALLYGRLRAAPVVAEAPHPGLQRVALRRTDLDVLKRFVELGDRLRHRPAPGLGAAVDAARFNAASNRWILYVDGEQMQSMARAFYLERLGGSAAPANRFARVYGVIHPPRPLPLRAEAEHDAAGR
ncbi:hypothetical protein G3I40_38000 [Streptomyces sp. SID14478]|uniref:DUF6417 family protein n=1 Tax=Streptomyces sp. SID14478 TaxID=2706073 RepID=UPI0013DE8788|nr:DUF6417 family protein [Streptomyces sp. SID14478]NEB80963.1 hypothetical protein [Streptomyces sp. SID14478]